MDNDAKIHDCYDKYLKKFCKRFEKGLEQCDPILKKKTGYVFIFVRGLEPGMIDVVSNMPDLYIRKAMYLAEIQVAQKRPNK